MELEHKPHAEHVETVYLDRTGHLGNQVEHEEGALQALRLHWKTNLWIVYAIWVLVACSFDNQASAGILGIPKFRKDFGHEYEGAYVLPAKWQSAYSGGPAAAMVAGSFLAGCEYKRWQELQLTTDVVDRIGRKLLVGGCFLIVMAGISVEIIANTKSDPNAVFFAGKFINGFAIGGLISTSMTYVGELAPTALRGVFTAACALAFTIGPFMQSFIVNAYGDHDTTWAYKSGFVAQYAVTGIAMILWPFMPESPTWLLTAEKDQKAALALRRLGYSGQRLDQKLAILKLTLTEAKKETDGVTYLECFRKSNLRRTIVASMPLTIQAFSGVFWIAGYATYYYQLGGYSTSMSFRLGIIQQVLSVLGNVCSWFMVERYGRRFLNLYGLVILTVLLFLTGGIACIGTVSANKAVSAFILIYCFLYNATIGATGYVAMTEISTSRLRAKTSAIALLCQSCWSTFWSFILPFMFNPDKGNLGAKCAFIFGATSIICCVYLFFCHPETKGRTYEELDEMFRLRIPARKFASYVPDAQKMGEEVKDAVDQY